MGKISAKDYIGWVVAIICAFIAGGFFTQKEHLQSENNKLVRIKQEVNNSARTIRQYVITNNYNLPEPIKINLDNIATVSEDSSVVLGSFSDKK